MLRRLNELLRGRILWAVSRFVCFVVADGTDLGATLLTFPGFATMLNSDIFRADPLATGTIHTVDAVLTCVLEVLAVERLLEIIVK